MRTWTALLAAVLLASVAMAQPGPPDRLRAPRDVGLTVSQILEGDTLVWMTTWQAPPRGRLGAPIEGYLVQFVRSDQPGEADEIPAGNRTPADSLVVVRRIAHDCATHPVAYYRVRVKAEGTWDPSEVPWGESNEVEIRCGGPPTEPPVIVLDTIPLDTLPDPPEIEMETTALTPHITVTSEGVRASALGERVRACAYTVRDGVRAAAGWQTGVYLPARPALAYEPVDGAQACWTATVTAVPEE